MAVDSLYVVELVLVSFDNPSQPLEFRADYSRDKVREMRVVINISGASALSDGP